MCRIGLLALVVVMGCGDDFDGSLHDDGEVGGHCYPNGTCNVGLGCAAGVCVPFDAGSSVSDAVSDAVTDAPADAALLCADDSALEPNDSIATAFQTPVATIKSSLTFAGLAICPAGDRDTYGITITTTGMNLEVIVEYAPEGMPLQASILNPSNVPIANASPVTGMPRHIRAYIPNLPTGMYYPQVYASPGEINNYKLTLTVTGP